MPGNFGSIKRCAVVGDPHSSNKRISVYLISEDSEGKLVSTNNIVKQNIKSWISKYKPMNDVVEMLDAKVVNFGIEFSIITDINSGAFEILSKSTQALRDYFRQSSFNVGESIRYGDILRELKNIDGLLDVTELKIVRKTGSAYSTAIFNIDQMTTANGRMVMAPSDVIFELKYPEVDIIGTVS